MSDFFDDSHVTDVGLQGSSGPAVGFWDLVQQGYRQQYRVDSQRALDEELRTRWAESLRALSAAGQRFNAPVDPLMYRGFAQFVRDGTPVTTPTVEGSGYGARINYDAQQPSPEFEEMRRANEAIRQLNNPDIRTFEQILEEVSEMQRGVEEQTASMSERGGTSGFIGELIGAIGGSFTTRDPLNIVTAPIGAGRTIATRIAADMAVAAGVVTATEFGDVAPNRALAGLPERDPLLNIVAATAGAGFIRGGIEGVGYGVRRFRERPVVEDIDFDLRDSQLRQMFETNDGPTARAGAQALDDITFIERNNPYGEGQAAQARFLAELQEVQRVMGGEPMTAVARVLPPLPFEFIQKAADFEIVREQSPQLYARMEQAQARFEALTRQVDEVSEQLEIIDSSTLNSRFTDDKGRFNITAAGKEIREQIKQEISRGSEVTLIVEGKPRRIVGTRALGLVDEQNQPWGLASIFMPVKGDHARVEIKRPQAAPPDIALRRAANKEYKAFYGAVEREAVRLREAQARAEAAQQREAVHIFADATYGRPFNWSALQYDHVQARVDAINAFNDTLDEKAVAAFIRQAEGGGEEALGRTGPLEGEPLPKNGLAPAFLGKDGTIYVGPEGGLHSDIKLPKGALEDITNWSTSQIDGFVTPEGRYLTREEALTWATQNESSENLSEIASRLTSPESVRLEANAYALRNKREPVSWITENGRVDIGLREPVDPDFRITTDDGDMSVADAMRDLQDDADLDEAMRTCLR